MNYEQSLTEQNFLIYAAKHYLNPQCTSTDEFVEDLKRFKYLRKIFTRYKQSGKIKERLVINHLTILFNVFEFEACVRLLFLKLDSHWGTLKPFLLMLSALPESLENIGEHLKIWTADIGIDPKITALLRTI